jgi:hypothetical protein
MNGRSPDLTSTYFAPSRLSSGFLHFVRITVAGTVFDFHKIPFYVLRHRFIDIWLALLYVLFCFNTMFLIKIILNFQERKSRWCLDLNVHQ